jgi:hypothetical protein
MEPWSLPKARPISCNDPPAFQRRHMSVLCSAESLSRFPCVINTTFRKMIHIRWCCIDRLRPPDFSGSSVMVCVLTSRQSLVHSEELRAVHKKCLCRSFLSRMSPTDKESRWSKNHRRGRHAVTPLPKSHSLDRTYLILSHQKSDGAVCPSRLATLIRCPLKTSGYFKRRHAQSSQ